MQRLRSLMIIVLMGVVMASFSQCSSSRSLQKKSPVELEQVYCQRWVAGVQGGGSGINIFIPVKDLSVELDSVYFRGKAVQLEIKPGETMYVGRFMSDFNKPKDPNVVMSSDPKAEYGNKLPELPQKIPFELKDDECVISYKDGKKTKYFKVENVVEKDLLAYPSAPPKKQ